MQKISINQRPLSPGELAEKRRLAKWVKHREQKSGVSVAASYYTKPPRGSYGEVQQWTQDNC